MTAVPSSSAGPRVVVGVDGSADSVAALKAAARAAELLEAALVVVTTWMQPVTFGRPPLWLPDFQGETEELQAAVIRAAFDGSPPVTLRRVVRSGAPGAALMRESDGASLVVVGRRGHGGFAGLLLGSTAMGTVVRAHCSVLVLAHTAHVAPPEVVDEPGPRRVVVGVDGDVPALRALVAADRAAALLDARLDVVTAWVGYGREPESLDELRDAVAATAGARQEAAIAQVVPADRQDRVRRIAREGPPAAVLVGESDGAALLVVGIRSRSALVEVFAGAVALTTAAHADCPVLVVRGDLARIGGPATRR